MRVLYEGLSGNDVTTWQYFLLGINPLSNLVANGMFDVATSLETKAFQRASDFIGRNVDGVVGPKTLGKALLAGFNPLSDVRIDESSVNWPPRPTNGPLTYANRAKLFGTFAYRTAATATNPEAIIITDDWSRNNIVTVNLPQLQGVSGAPANYNVTFNKNCSTQLQRLFIAWETAGHKDKILTWAGSWAPRFIRGSRTTLSNHAWATAFDINVQWNMLGTPGALKGQKGSVRELVQIAYEHGFFWGGWFGYKRVNGSSGRYDAMHFEAFKIIP